MPSVHFIAHHPAEDAVSRYRCINFADQLTALGWQTGFTCIFDPGTVSVDSDVIVLNRILANANVLRFAKALKEGGRALVFGLDDLVFDPAWIEKEVAEAAEGEKDRVRREVAGYQRALRETLDLCHCALVSTEFLAEKVRQAGKPAFVLRNTSPDNVWEFSKAAWSRVEAARHSSPVTHHSSPKLGYFSGTRTHNRDFASIGKPLEEAFDRYENLLLLLVGPVDVPENLRRFHERIEHKPAIGWRDLPQLLASVGVNLAPLDLDFEFNLGKSHLKWLEAGAVGVPTIASHGPDFRASIEQGIDGWLAHSDSDWLAAIESAMERHKEVGESAKEKIERNFLWSRQAAETDAVFRRIRREFCSEGKLGPPPVLKRTGAAGKIGGKVRREVGKLLRRGSFRYPINRGRAG